MSCVSWCNCPAHSLHRSLLLSVMLPSEPCSLQLGSMRPRGGCPTPLDMHLLNRTNITSPSTCCHETLMMLPSPLPSTSCSRSVSCSVGSGWCMHLTFPLSCVVVAATSSVTALIDVS